MRNLGMLDVARAAEALSRPGIDPRVWTTLAVINAINVTAAGVYCDVTTIMGVEETAVLSPEYAGDGYGFYFPLEVGHMVLVAIPEGEYATGARIIARVWDEGDPPPDVVAEHPEDVALVVKPGKTVRVVVSGGGKVLLGGADATRGVARVNDSVALKGQTGLPAIAQLQVLLDTRYLVQNPGSNLTAGVVIGTISTASDDVKST